MVNLVTVPGVELMKVGKWDLSTGAWECTPHEINAAVDAHQQGLLRKPVIRLGHNDPRFSGDPAVGWLDNLRASADGQALIGDMVGVPEWLADIMPSAYPSRSIEGLYDYTAPDGSDHDFVLTGLALLGATKPGVESLQSLQDVARLYDIAAAGLVGGKAIEITIQAAEADKTEKGATVASFEKIAEKLGLPADADEAAVLEALNKVPAEAVEVEAPAVEVEVAEVEAPASVEPVAVAAAAGNLVTVEASAFSQMQADAAAGRAARDRQIADDDHRVVAAAIGDGKVPPARKDHWLSLMKADREGTTQVLASLAAGLVPVSELGHSIPGEGGNVVDAAMEKMHERVMAGAGFRTTKREVSR